MRLALFDLDHTLIAFDSGMAWTRFLIGRGWLDAGAEAVYLDECRRYVAGSLDIDTLHRALVAPLGALDAGELAQRLEAFECAMSRQLPSAARALVEQHQATGDLCCIVTATTRPIAAPFARAFGVEHLLATEPALDARGRLSGEIDGLPCYREHKLARLADWLASHGQRLQDFERSWFYSDSANDLPLLEAVSDPVAVRPDARLRAVAVRRRWAIIENLAD